MQALMLPDGLVPEDFASASPYREGTLALDRMPRLVPLLAASDGQAWVRLRGDEDEAGRRIVEGELRAEVPLRCHRCLGVYYHRVAGAFRVVVVASEADGDALPDELEPFVCAGSVQPLTVAEEEILLGLPVVARHDEGECAPPGHDAGVRREELSPFAALRGHVRPADSDD